MVKRKLEQKGRKATSGVNLKNVMTAASWLRHQGFKNEDEARGAFRLAYYQWLDGVGDSPEEWMGLNSEEFRAWMKDDSLPRRAKRK